MTDNSDDPPSLSGPQARLVRSLFQQAMARRGRELTADQDGNLRDGSGHVYGLRTIAAACHAHPGGEDRWEQLIEGYADVVSRGAGQAWTDIAALTAQQARTLIYPSIVRAASLGRAVDGYRAAPELVPGLLELLALDLPDYTVFVDDDQVARLGGRESLRDAALANLRALAAPVHQHVGTPDAHFEAIGGDSHFAASRALAMPDLLSGILRTDAPHGVLVAVPARRWAFIHVLSDQTAQSSLLAMAKMARAAYGREEGPISPDVFWWRDGGWMPVPAIESGGSVHLRPGPELSFLLADLAGNREAGG